MGFRFLWSLAFGLVLLTSVPASAQISMGTPSQTARPGRPYRGLFSSGTADWTEQLIATGMGGVGYDSNVLADLTHRDSAAAGSDASRAGVLGQVAGSLAYSHLAEKFSWAASGTIGRRYYPSGSDDAVQGSAAMV